MSIQNNLDIIIASHIKPDLQSGKEVVAPKNQTSSNFEEMLAAAKTETQNSEPVKEQSVEKKTEVAEKEDSEKVEKNNTPAEKSEEKIQSKEEVKTEPGTAVKNVKSEKTAVLRGEKTVEKKDETKKLGNQKDVKKLAEKKPDQKSAPIDYEKFNLIGQKKDSNETVAKETEQKTGIAVKTAKFVKENNFDQEQNKKVLSNKTEAVAVESKEINFKELLASSKNESEGETDFTGNEEKRPEVKISKLDKDGKITVQDERTKLPAEEKIEKSELKTKNEVKFEDDKSATITMNVAQDAQANVLSSDTQSAAATNSNYQTMFSNQLAQSAPDFVQAGKIILKDNNQGTINLVIHPDDLGNVKIHLSLDGKSVSAQITVATKEAMEIFKDNAETLREAFIKQGFENATFDVSYGNNSGLGQNSEFTEQNDGRELYARRAYSDILMQDDAGYEDFENISNPGNYSVNIVA